MGVGLKSKTVTCFPLNISGYEVHTRRVQAAGTDKLSICYLPVNATVLDAGPLQTPTLPRCRQCAGQTSAEPRVSYNNCRHRPTVGVTSHRRNKNISTRLNKKCSWHDYGIEIACVRCVSVSDGFNQSN